MGQIGHIYYFCKPFKFKLLHLLQWFETSLPVPCHFNSVVICSDYQLFFHGFLFNLQVLVDYLILVYLGFLFFFFSKFYSLTSDIMLLFEEWHITEMEWLKYNKRKCQFTTSSDLELTSLCSLSLGLISLIPRIKCSCKI